MLLTILIAAALSGEIPITSSSPQAVGFLREGREKALNFQNTQAAELFRKALELDPSFAQALAWLGKVTPGAAGVSDLERAVQLAEKLSPAERKSVEVFFAERKGEDEKARNLKRELAEMAPGDWLAQLQLGVQSYYDHKSQAAIVYLNRTVTLNPKAAEPYNYLGYVLSNQGQYEEGIRAMRKFVEMKPQESNSHDSLGEVLLMSGKYGEAEASFQTSAELAPADSLLPWMGIAYSRFFRGNFEGGRDAGERAKKSLARASDKLAVDEVIAWSYLAEDKLKPALKHIEAIEKEALQNKNDFMVAWSAFERAEMLFEAGQGTEALKHLEEARSRGEKGKLTGAEQNRLRREGLVLQARIGAGKASPVHAERALAQLEAELKSAPSNADVRGKVHYVRGLVALARGQPGQAAESLALCPETDYRCRLDLARAHAQAGNKAAAEETRTRLSHANARDNIHRGEDPAYLYISSRLRAGPLPQR